NLNKKYVDIINILDYGYCHYQPRRQQMAETGSYLSQAIETAFGETFGGINEELALLTALAEKIRAGVKEQRALLGRDYTATFAPQSPGLTDVPKTSPVELEVKAPGNQLVCRISATPGVDLFRLHV